jgi:hypothetical protein
MWIDPVVDEIHEVRQKMIADVHGDLTALMVKFYAHQNSQPGVLIGERLPVTSSQNM